MAYEAKINWKLDDTVMPDDLNRIEKGIQDLGLKMSDIVVKKIIASDLNIVDFNSFIEPGIYIIIDANSSTTINGSNIGSSNKDVILFVYKQTPTLIYQSILGVYGNMDFRLYNLNTLEWLTWRNHMSASLLTISTSGWTTTSPYTQNIASAVFYASDAYVTVTPQWSSDVTIRKAQQEAWNCVSMIETYDGGIKVTCDDEIPSTEIPIRVLVQR